MRVEGVDGPATDEFPMDPFGHHFRHQLREMSRSAGLKAATRASNTTLKDRTECSCR